MTMHTFCLNPLKHRCYFKSEAYPVVLGAFTSLRAVTLLDVLAKSQQNYKRFPSMPEFDFKSHMQIAVNS
ncbi:hypothetical protein MHTCC0001_00580 [Flavobacteriaceae bacterium MHTCC 0001]